jgi:hypothetical protein
MVLDSPVKMDQDHGEIIIEGALLKQGSRSRSFFHERYFRFSSDHTIKYYNNKYDVVPKGAYNMSELPDCEISDLFVQKRHKQIIYCIKITWSVDSDSLQLADESLSFDDAVSTEGITSNNATSTGMHTVAEENWAQEGSFIIREDGDFIDSSPARSEKVLTPLKRLRRSLSGGKKNRSSSQNSHNHRHTQGQGEESMSSLNETYEEVATSTAGIPSLVQADPRHSQNIPDINNRTRRTSFELQCQEEQRYLQSQFITSQKESKKRAKRKLVTATKVATATGAVIGLTVVTAGLGLVTGLLVLGTGAIVSGGGAAVAAGAYIKKKVTGEIVIASGDYDTARRWKACLDGSLESKTLKTRTWGQLFVSEGRTSALLPENGDLFKDVAYERPCMLEKAARWVPLDGGLASYLGNVTSGLRLFREERDEQLAAGPLDWFPSPPIKAQTVIGASALDAFLCLMSLGRMTVASEKELIPNSEQRSSFRILQQIDKHGDIIHLVFRPLYLFPSWTMPRDFVLFRYWRLEPDGSYMVCFDSMRHPECPPMPNYVRGKMHQVITFAPQKKSYLRRTGATKSTPQECFVTAIAQIDPRGWVPFTPLPFFSNQGYGDAFAITALSHVQEIRYAINQDRFVAVSKDNHEQDPFVRGSYSKREKEQGQEGIVRNLSGDSLEFDEPLPEDDINYDFAYVAHEATRERHVINYDEFANTPPHVNQEKWAEPDPTAFRVRGPSYLQNRVKVNSGPSIGRLICSDIVTVDEPLFSGISTHPADRIQLGLEREKEQLKKGAKSTMPPFVFVVNISLPGPPFYHGVFYYAIDDMSTIDGSDGSPSSKLCKEFFFGDSDEFRDKTFKMIPAIIEGNFIVRQAVGSTPAIMGTKLRQLYVKSDRFFEVILDCGSSAVATGVIRLSLGYAKTLVIDMGFVLEGDEEEYLPERIMGCVRTKNPEFGPFLRKVETPPS